MEDTYVIPEDASELTVCVSPPLPCTLVLPREESANVKCVSASVTRSNGTPLGEVIFCYYEAFKYCKYTVYCKLSTKGSISYRQMEEGAI